MKLLALRDTFDPSWTLSTLTIDGKAFGVAVEPGDKGLDSSMPIADILARKVPGETAIPTGIYPMGIRFSPKHQREVLYLLGVPGFNEGTIELHSGGSATDSDGCLCVGIGRDRNRGTITKSKAAVRWLETHPEGPMARIRAGGEVWIEVRRAA